MPRGVAAGVFGDAGEAHGLFHRSLDDRLVNVMVALLAGAWVLPALLLREDPLPAPVGRGIRVLARECLRQLHTASTFGEVALVDGSRAAQPVVERRLQHARQRGNAVLVVLTVADDDLAARELKEEA